MTQRRQQWHPLSRLTKKRTWPRTLQTREALQRKRLAARVAAPWTQQRQRLGQWQWQHRRPLSQQRRDRMRVCARANRHTMGRTVCCSSFCTKRISWAWSCFWGGQLSSRVVPAELTHSWQRSPLDRAHLMNARARSKSGRVRGRWRAGSIISAPLTWRAEHPAE